MASQSIYLEIPGTSTKIYPGYKIKLNRFDSDLWTVHYGWFDFSGNRPMLGWYLTNDTNSNSVKPVQKTDLYDIYLVDTSIIEGITVDVVQSDYAENSTLSASYIQNRPYFTETFDELNSRYFPHSMGTADIGLPFMRFDNITISLVDAQSYVVTINLDGKSSTGTAVATTWTHNSQLVQIKLDDDTTLYLILNGDFIGTRLSYIPNTVVVLGDNISSASELSISITGLKFEYVKQMPKDSLSLPQYRYVTYPSNLCKFIANVDTQNPTQVHIYAVVPVCDEASSNYYISNGIRAGYIHITPYPNITINSDLYAKDQNWEIWTINMEDKDSKICWGMDKVVATTILDETIAPHVNAVMSCKTYTVSQPFDETLPIDIWAGNLVTVYMDTEESAKNLVTSIAENSLLKDVAITVRLQDISYTEEVAKVTTSPEGVIPAKLDGLAAPISEDSPTKFSEVELVRQLVDNLQKSHNSEV